MTATGEELRARATAHDQEARDSFERCDTDGFLTQWAHGVNAERLRLEADIAEQDGTWVFPALFGLDGAMVPAKYTQTRYGMTWALLDPEDPEHGRFVGFFGPSEAATSKAQKKSDARRGGYFVGLVRVRARAVLRGGSVVSVRAYPERCDGGYDPGAQVVCNGQGPDLENGLGGVYGRYYQE